MFLIRRLGVGVVLAVVALVAWVSFASEDATDNRPVSASKAAGAQDSMAPPTTPVDASVLSDPTRSGMPYGTTVSGLLTFRGNPTRSYYGQGPVPGAPKVDWFYPNGGGMCSTSTAKGETKQWCGSGWTGQPAVFERGGRTWVVFGAYDRAVHFIDADTGEDILAPFPTGDIIKGSVTVDPDGFPLIYTGSRDNFYRVISIDQPGGAEELWKLSATAVSPTLWNNDWDGSGLVLDDYLLEGGENSQFHMAKLNRAYGADGLVTVDPELVFHTPSWDAQVTKDLAGNRDSEMSIENSVAVWKDTVYFSNSGGLVQGWDLAPVRTGGTPRRTFRFWTGDDQDASIVIDSDGFLYAAVEYERSNARAKEVGQLIKLDPTRPDDPIVWSVKDQETSPAGIWSTPAIWKDLVITTTDGGRVMGIDRATGDIRWTKRLPGPVWQSPVVVDDVLIQGDCNGMLHGYSLADTLMDPPEVWSLDLGGCIESTPAVWKGRIYVGTRAGRFFAMSDDGTLISPTAGTAGGTGGD